MNIVEEKRNRYWLLERRKDNLSSLTDRGEIQRDGNGNPLGFYPNLNFSRKAERIIGNINKEQKEIFNWIKKYHYSLK